MKNKKLLLYILLGIFFIFSIESKKKSKESVDPNNNTTPDEFKSRFITFKINRLRWSDIDHFSRILGEFFLNAGIKMQLVNMGDSELLGICSEGTEIDKEAVLENFAGIVESVDIAD